MAAAARAGATITAPAADMFWGDRYGKLIDPFGHSWLVARHIADPTPEQMETAVREIFGGGRQGCDWVRLGEKSAAPHLGIRRAVTSVRRY